MTRLSLIVISATLAVPAQTPQAGNKVELRATHHLGVPLHKEAGGPPDFDRVPDGIHAVISEIQQNNRWFKVTVQDGRVGWLVKRYIGRILDGGPTPVDPHDEEKVWQSGESCLEVLNAGRRMAKVDPSALVVATWNIRWFARGCSPNESCPENVPEVDWLACSIAWMNVDVLAVQEIMTSQNDKAQLANLIEKLNTHTKGSWHSDLQSCGSSTAQHVGYLWNGTKIQLTNLMDVWELNPNATGGSNACAGSLRPGRYARATSVGGGVDFNVISVHLDSGTSDRDYQNRRKSVDALSAIDINGQELPLIDIDTIVLGDFNTMGRLEQPVITADQEIQTFQEELASGFQRVLATPACTEYFDNKGGVLDHIVVSAGMSEAATTARVSGYCAVRACSPIVGTPPPAYERLSDHCPVLVEITNTDTDQ
jgi:endonuclease/exonuclease/phosphatase family metal-dependent hydrolase